MKTTITRRLRSAATVSMIALMLGQPAFAQSQVQNPEQAVTETPIKHLIVIVGENRSFDNVFATYQPKSGQKVWNLLSQGIVNADGTPGPNFAAYAQQEVTSSDGRFALNPTNKQPYKYLPVPTLQHADSPAVGLEFGIVNPDGTPTALFPQGDPDLPRHAQILLATGGAPASSGTDTRVVGAEHLPAGPFQQTGPTLPYDSYEATRFTRCFRCGNRTTVA